MPRSSFRLRLFATSLAVMAVTLTVLAAALSAMLEGADTTRVLLWSLLPAFGAGLVAASLVSHVAARPFVERLQALARIATRDQGEEAGPRPLMTGEDELAVTARVVDASIQGWSRRVDALARDRTRMEAVLA